MKINEYKKENYTKNAEYNSVCPCKEQSVDQDQIVFHHQLEEMEQYQ